ncbi:MAG: hypothetical protein J6T55_00675 [Alphaproteobacteria bacterium]|nr:hypothetical protein [Alphaproteobacteria bacterium]
MEETESQKRKIEEYKSLTKKIRRVYLYDTLKTIMCMGALFGCGELALFTHSNNVRKTALATAVCAGLASVGTKRLLDKKSQKLTEQRTQVLKEYAQLSKV